ncbi:MAG: UDP-N-acetylmuramate dehydrogenase [Myxococcota bacterium]
MKSIADKLAGKVKGKVKTGVPLSELTTYQIGGPAEILIEPKEPNDIAAVVKFCRKAAVPLTVLGGGSNVLAPDEGVRGVLLRLFDKASRPELQKEHLSVSAATSSETLALFAAEKGVKNFEFLYDIPGALGGAIVQNASNDYGELSALIEDVTFIDESGNPTTLPARELGFGYRNSRFKERFGVVVSARLKIAERGAKDEIRERMEEIRRIRRGKFPMEYPNCGSVFKRPPGDYAGRLIESAGLGGLRVGNAMVSPKHKNFIVNLGGAKASDIKALVEKIQSAVEGKFGVELERELIYL